MVGRLYHLGKREAAAAGRRAAGAVRAHRRGQPAGEDLLRRHAPPARHRRLADRPAAGAVPRRADDRARPAQPAGHVGVHRRPGPTAGRRSCSPPSTSRRPTGSPTGWSSSTSGRVIARGTADELKAQVGGERLEFTVADRSTSSPRSPTRCGALAGGEPQRRRADPAASAAGRAVAPTSSPRRCAGSTARRRRCWTSGCAGPTSTTSSSP